MRRRRGQPHAVPRPGSLRPGIPPPRGPLPPPHPLPHARTCFLRMKVEREPYTNSAYATISIARGTYTADTMSTVRGEMTRPSVLPPEREKVRPTIAEETPPMVVAMLHHDRKVRSLAAGVAGAGSGCVCGGEGDVGGGPPVCAHRSVPGVGAAAACAAPGSFRARRRSLQAQLPLVAVRLAPPGCAQPRCRCRPCVQPLVVPPRRRRTKERLGLHAHRHLARQLQLGARRVVAGAEHAVHDCAVRAERGAVSTVAARRGRGADAGGAARCGAVPRRAALRVAPLTAPHATKALQPLLTCRHGCCCGPRGPGEARGRRGSAGRSGGAAKVTHSRRTYSGRPVAA